MKTLSMILALFGIPAILVGIGIWISRASRSKGKIWMGCGTALVGLVLLIVGGVIAPPEMTERVSEVFPKLKLVAISPKATPTTILTTATETPAPTATTEPTVPPTMTPVPPLTPTATPTPTPAPLSGEDGEGDVGTYEYGAPVESPPDGVDIQTASLIADLKIALQPTHGVPKELSDWASEGEALLWFTLHRPVPDPPKARTRWLFALDVDGDIETGRPVGTARINPDLGMEAAVGVRYDAGEGKYVPYLLVWNSAQGGWVERHEVVRFHLDERRTLIGLALPLETLTESVAQASDVTLKLNEVEGRAAAVTYTSGQRVIDFYPDLEEREKETMLVDIDWLGDFEMPGSHCLSSFLNKEENKYRYPNDYDTGEGDYPPEVPKSEFYHLLSIPFHSSNKILRAYLPIKAETREEQGVWMIVYDKKQKTSELIGAVKPTYGSNYGGIFLPYEIVKDDSKVILKACMGPHAAGGALVNLGYKTLSFRGKELNWIAEPEAYFYDSFGKVVYVTEGDKTPHYQRPGPSNDAAVHFRNLVQEEEEVLLEEKDTSYEIMSLDEESKILNFEATKYYFSEECPREEGAQQCAETSITNRSISLP